MTTRSGWIVDGKHFSECFSVRMGSPIHVYHIDGKRTPSAVWHKAYQEALKAEAAKSDKRAV